MNNAQIAARFEQLADLLEFDGANAFRIRAYRNAARTIENLPRQISDLVEAEEDLTKLEGIGKDLAEKCVALVETGQLKQLDELLEKIPSSVLAMLRIPGLGPKKAAVLYHELKVANLEDLRLACQQHRVRELKGFAAKTEQTILEGIDLAATADDRVYWATADQIVYSLLEHLKSCSAIEKIEAAGSYRRGQETVGDIDILTVSTEVEPVMDRLAEFPELDTILARGDTKMSIRLTDGMQVDLRVVPAESFGAALQYFTGSKQHNVKVRGIAKQKGLKINEYGVYRLHEDADPEYLAGKAEEEVYATLDLPWFPPELRENRDEFQWVTADGPRLIELEDIRGDLHMHTTATDGKHSLEQMAQAAIAFGHQYIAITDHSQRVSMANGLTAERLLDQWKQIDQLNEKLDGKILVLKGIECDILEQGGMDLPDDVLAEADWVIASIHYGQKQPRAQITDRILGALNNPHVTMLAHPTGRLLNRRPPYEVDLEAVFQAAKENHKLLELNANPARLDLNDVHCHAAQAQGIPLVINSDAHSIDGLGVLRYGIKQARRGYLQKQDVANTKTWKQIQKLLGRG
ncbi:MAG: DNA polymerase/3'-5' exonuclease PolX [Pirellulaceae bacterium]